MTPVRSLVPKQALQRPVVTRKMDHFPAEWRVSQHIFCLLNRHQRLDEAVLNEQRRDVPDLPRLERLQRLKMTVKERLQALAAPPMVSAD